jgi:pyruvate ferredoxin oxidoreductase gamma subunit
MEQIRIHGRGGQGVVTAAELIAMSAFYDGKQAQAFPSFGVERTGAPIEAFARISDRPIRLREQIQRPDIIIVQDATLLGTVDIGKGAGSKTRLIINTSKPKEEIMKTINFPADNIFPIDATRIAMDVLGRNIVNTVIIGSFAKATGLVSLEAVKKAIAEKFGEKGKELVEKNVKAVEMAYSD